MKIQKVKSLGHLYLVNRLDENEQKRFLELAKKEAQEKFNSSAVITNASPEHVIKSEESEDCRNNTDGAFYLRGSREFTQDLNLTQVKWDAREGVVVRTHVKSFNCYYTYLIRTPGKVCANSKDF